MKRLLFVLMLGLCIGSVAWPQPLPTSLSTTPAPATETVRVESPKGRELRLSSGSAMAVTTTNKPRTNIFCLNLAWAYAAPLPNTFVLQYGRAPGSWTNSLPTGQSNTFNLRLTNWVERADRHWYVVRARKDGLDSGPSNEIFWPPYPVSHLLLQWRTNWPAVTVLHSTNLNIPRAQWQAVGVVTNGRCWTTNLLDGSHFFVINQPDTLSVLAFNPMNLAMGQSLCQTNYVAPPPPSVPLTNGLAAYFKMSEADLDRQSEVGGYALGQQNTASIGKIASLLGFAATFDGDDRHIDSAFDPAGNTPYVVAGDFTCAVWFHDNGANGGALICGILNDSTPTDGQWGITAAGNGFVRLTWVDDGGNVSNSNEGEYNNTWVHAVFVYHWVAQSFEFYVDGVAVDSSTAVPINPSPSSFPFGVGGDGNSGRGFWGNVDELGIWHRALSPAEVATLYNGGTGITYPF